MRMLCLLLIYDAMKGPVRGVQFGRLKDQNIPFKNDVFILPPLKQVSSITTTLFGSGLLRRGYDYSEVIEEISKIAVVS